ncbi:MAG: insulinase family protein [Psychrobium sp.]|nr:insulinase family protein [Psychrobium sp.]
MKYNRLSVCVIAAMLAITGCQSASDNAKNTANAEQNIRQSNDIKFEKFVLDNGLEVVFHTDHSDPVVAVTLTSHVGSAREETGRTGFAHLFEHLLFLESENLGKGGLDKLSARIGGSGANGSTSRDRTNYYQAVPSNALEKMLWAESDKLGFFINTVTEQVLAKEKQVVKNEKRQSQSNRPYGHTYAVIDKTLYPEGHPYSWQVIGSLADLQNATLDDVKTFFKRWYVPNNVTLVVSGDFDTKQAKQWVHKYFDEIKRGEDIVPNKKQPVTLTASKKVMFEDNLAQLPALTMVWPTVPIYHDDTYALAVLSILLADGKSSPLNAQLVDTMKVTSSVDVDGYESELAGQFILNVRGFEGVKLDNIKQGIDIAFANFEKNGVSDTDLNRIKAGQETAFYRGISSVLGKGFQLAQYNIFANDPDFINNNGKKILAVTKEDVLRVYHQYIKNKYFVATSFVPKGQTALALSGSKLVTVEQEQIVNGAEQSFDASQQAEYVKTPSTFDRSIEPKYGKDPVLSTPNVWQKTLDNGLKVSGITSSETPLVQLNIELAGGMLFDDVSKVGVANLVGEILNRGTKTKTITELENAIKSLGANIGTYSTADSIRITATVLAKNYDATIALITEMLLEPRWDTVEFEQIKQQIRNDLLQQRTSPGAIANNQMNKLMYGADHIYSHNQAGDIKTLESITIDDLKAYYAANFTPSLTTVQVVGDIDEKKVLNAFTRLNKQWAAKKRVFPQIKQPTLPVKSAIYFYDVPGAKQSQLRIGHPALLADNDNYYNAQVMNYRLGGGSFASILTQQLRETKGYTYGVRSGFNGNKYQSEFLISSGVRSNVTLESIALIRELTTSYGKDFSQQDLDTTKSFYLKSNARRFETLGAKLSILRNMANYNLPANYVQLRANDISAMTASSVKALAKQYLHPNKMIYLVVGDAKTQLKRLEELGLGKPTLLN